MRRDKFRVWAREIGPNFTSPATGGCFWPKIDYLWDFAHFWPTFGLGFDKLAGFWPFGHRAFGLFAVFWQKCPKYPKMPILAIFDYFRPFLPKPTKKPEIAPTKRAKKSRYVAIFSPGPSDSSRLPQAAAQRGSCYSMTQEVTDAGQKVLKRSFLTHICHFPPPKKPQVQSLSQTRRRRRLMKKREKSGGIEKPPKNSPQNHAP